MIAVPKPIDETELLFTRDGLLVGSYHRDDSGGHAIGVLNPDTNESAAMVTIDPSGHYGVAACNPKGRITFAIHYSSEGEPSLLRFDVRGRSGRSTNLEEPTE